MTIRKVTLDDLELLIQMRFDYMEQVNGTLTREQKAELRAHLITYFQKHIPAQTFLGVVAEIDGEVVSTAWMSVLEKPASLLFMNGRTGTLLNVLTYAGHRRKGYSSQVIRTLLREARAMDISTVQLLATPDGEYLYRSLGFERSAYPSMSIDLT